MNSLRVLLQVSNSDIIQAYCEISGTVELSIGTVRRLRRNFMGYMPQYVTWLLSMEEMFLLFLEWWHNKHKQIRCSSQTSLAFSTFFWSSPLHQQMWTAQTKCWSTLKLIFDAHCWRPIWILYLCYFATSMWLSTLIQLWIICLGTLSADVACWSSLEWIWFKCLWSLTWLLLLH